jgi:hypothetical protein
MRRRAQDNENSDHNATITHNITCLPMILLYEQRAPGSEHAKLVREILRAEVVYAKKFTTQYLIPGTREYKSMETATTEKDRATVRAISLLRYAASAENPAAAKALRDAAQILLPDHPGRGAIVKPPLYVALLKQEMKRAWSTMWIEGGEAVPALVCPDLRCALFVASAYKAVDTCPNCHRLFAVDSTRIDGSLSTKYCKAVCGQRFRQKMYRLKLKKSKRKGRS